MTSEAVPFAYALASSGSHDRTYVPFVYPGVDREFAQFGEIALLRETGYAGNVLYVGFWRVGPATSPLYDVPLGDEMGFVIRGRARIDLLAEDRRTVLKTFEIGPGDVYTFRKGLLQRWTILEDFEKFVVVADHKPAVAQSNNATESGGSST